MEAYDKLFGECRVVKEFMVVSPVDLPPAEPSPADVLIVVPCYDEADRLPVACFRDFVDAEAGYRFLFVNDGSRDGTAEVLTRQLSIRSGLCWATHLM